MSNKNDLSQNNESLQHNELLRIEAVSYWRSNERRLSPLSLTLQLGECKFIVGPSGCGKSTLLKIIASLLAPSSGRIFFQGQDIQQLPPEQYRRQVAYCFQTPHLFGDTVYDNFALPYQIRQQPVNHAKIAADLSRLHLPASILTQPISELSGGEKQRVSLLRSLQFMPKVLLLDEATSALDMVNKQCVQQMIATLISEEQLAVLWVTHDTAEIATANAVIALQHPDQS